MDAVSAARGTQSPEDETARAQHVRSCLHELEATLRGTSARNASLFVAVIIAELDGRADREQIARTFNVSRSNLDQIVHRVRAELLRRIEQRPRSSQPAAALDSPEIAQLVRALVAER